MDASADTVALMRGCDDDFEEREGAVSVFVGERWIGQWRLDSGPPAGGGGQGDSVSETNGLVMGVGDNGGKSCHGGVAFESLTVSFH